MSLHPELIHRVDLLSQLRAVIPKAAFRAVVYHGRVVWRYVRYFTAIHTEFHLLFYQLTGIQRPSCNFPSSHRLQKQLGKNSFTPHALTSY